MDRTTKNVITGVVTVAVGPVAALLLTDIYKGLRPDGSPIPFVFPLKAASATSSSATIMTVVDRKS
jgi:hypothetical protein